MTAFVTGGLGFIGLRVIEKLLDAGFQVVCIDGRSKLETYAQTRLPIFSRATRVISRCRDLLSPTMEFGAGPSDVIVHLGAVVDTKDAGPGIIDTNIDFTRRLLESHPSAGIVFASSGAVYGSAGYPCTVYGMTKALGENMLLTRRRAISLRFMNVYGEDEHHKGNMASMAFKIARAQAKLDPLEVFRLDDQRDFVYVDDVASAIVFACQRASKIDATETFDVGTGSAVSFRQLLEFVRKEGEPSVLREVGFPKDLEGRYQSHTAAGHMTDFIPNIFDFMSGCTPIEASVGVRKVRDALESK